jgi:hypothetical protein
MQFPNALPIPYKSANSERGLHELHASQAPVNGLSNFLMRNDQINRSRRVGVSPHSIKYERSRNMHLSGQFDSRRHIHWQIRSNTISIIDFLSIELNSIASIATLLPLNKFIDTVLSLLFRLYFSLLRDRLHHPLRLLG